jgi:hypothetical protein
MTCVGTVMINKLQSMIFYAKLKKYFFNQHCQSEDVEYQK